jgi:diamine N-acetyltransferase
VYAETLGSKVLDRSPVQCHPTASGDTQLDYDHTARSSPGFPGKVVGLSVPCKPCQNDNVDAVTLREIDESNRSSIEELQVHPDQLRFVESVTSSLQEAAGYDPVPWVRAIYDGDEPVGFVMLADDDPTCPWRYYLWRLLVDTRFQGRGYGRAALDHVATYVRTRPGGDELVTSVAHYGDERDQGSPLDFYLRCGFRQTGERHGPEIVLRLDLKAP